MSPRLDLSGQRFGSLIAVERAVGAPGRHTKWRCLCDCGAETLATMQHLRAGHTTSCGCARRRRDPRAWNLRPEYKIWRGMIARCENPNVKSYTSYGGAGVSVHPTWRHDFEAFFAEIGPRPSPRHSVERKDVTKNYEPGNVVWATNVEQCNNKRCTRYVVYRGVRQPLYVAVRAAGWVIHPQGAWNRIQHGWDVDEAIETPRLHVAHNARAA